MFLFIFFSAVYRILEKRFHFMICISFDNPICAWFSERFGLRNALLLACVMMLIGAFLKSFVNHNYTYLLAGQFLMAPFVPIFYINASKLSANWFPKHERIYTTMIAMISSSLGISIGFLFPNMFVPLTSKNIPVLKSSIVNMLNYLWMF